MTGLPRAGGRLVMSPRGLIGVAAFALVFTLAGASFSMAGGGNAAPEGSAEPMEPPKPPAKQKPGKPDPDAPGPDAQFVGSSFCDTPACHGSLVKEFHTIRHSHWASDPKYKDAAGCEVCHGPASDHVGDPDHRKIYRFTAHTPENSQRLNQACMQCHQKTLPRQHYQATAHTREGMDCASCHEVHYSLGTPYLLRYPGLGGPAGRPRSEREVRAAAKSRKEPSQKEGPAGPGGAPGDAGSGDPRSVAPPALFHHPQLEAAAKTRIPPAEGRSSFTREPEAVTEEQAVNEMCSSCHRRQLADARQFSHHPILEGRMKCTGCHDPHRAQEGKMLTRGDIASTCLECHEEIRGPFRFEHDPVKGEGLSESCLECHRPHGSPNRSLTTLFSRGLCIQCHTDIQRDPPHRGRAGSCWRSGCHVAIHGSNHSRFLFRE